MISMITARALSGVPEFLRDVAGERRLDRCLAAAGLPADIERLQESEGYIPQQSLLRFLDLSGRELGVELLGLSAVDHVSVKGYGIFGDYVLSAPTLLQSLARSIKAHGYHCTGDLYRTTPMQDGVQIEYRTAMAGKRGYENISYVGLGVIRSLVRHYVGPNWNPPEVYMDTTRTGSGDAIEEALSSAVRFGKESVMFRVPRDVLNMPAPVRKPDRQVTLADVARARHGGTPKTFCDMVLADIRAQMIEGLPQMDHTCSNLGLARRTFQRRLDADGATYRQLVVIALAGRAKDLLREPDISMTEIATDLGYATPSHFARAFKSVTALSPSEYRRSVAMPA